VIDPGFVTWIPSPAPSDEEVRMLRVASFARLWSEVKYNFVFLAQRKELDWERMLELYLPRIMAAKTDEEYVTVLKEAVALLRDGHSAVQGGGATDRPPVLVKPVEGRPVVTALAEIPELKTKGVAPGMELIAVDGTTVPQRLKQIYPTVFASTAQSREVVAFRRLLEGPPNSIARAVFRDLDGKEVEVELRRDEMTAPAKALPWRPPVLEWRQLGEGIVYMALNSFGSASIVKRFDEEFDKLAGARGLILDLRNNGGGSTSYGDQIIGRFIRPGERLKGSLWKTREYRPAFRAWGKPEEWYEGAHDDVTARATPYLGPIMVLLGSDTFSAAEDFVATLKSSKRATLVGSPTGGSTGQPLSVPLYRAFARICTKWDRLADGTEFVGVGVQPDVLAYPTRRDIAQGRDPVLERAVEMLRGK
jgi:C-terminal processing protease CtpA/Prc